MDLGSFLIPVGHWVQFCLSNTYSDMNNVTLTLGAGERLYHSNCPVKDFLKCWQHAFHNIEIFRLYNFFSVIFFIEYSSS